MPTPQHVLDAFDPTVVVRTGNWALGILNLSHCSLWFPKGIPSPFGKHNEDPYVVCSWFDDPDPTKPIRKDQVHAICNDYEDAEKVFYRHADLMQEII